MGDLRLWLEKIEGMEQEPGPRIDFKALTRPQMDVSTDELKFMESLAPDSGMKEFMELMVRKVTAQFGIPKEFGVRRHGDLWLSEVAFWKPPVTERVLTFQMIRDLWGLIGAVVAPAVPVPVAVPSTDLADVKARDLTNYVMLAPGPDGLFHLYSYRPSSDGRSLTVEKMLDGKGVECG